MLACSLYLPLMVDHLRSLGLSYFSIGVLGSLYSGVQLVSSPIIGSWSDIRGHRSVLQLTLLVSSTFYFVLGAATTFPLIFIARFFQGISEHTQVLCGSLLAGVVPSDKQSEVQGHFASFGGLGFIIGPIIGGHLIEYDNGFQHVCSIIAFVSIINFVLVYILIPNIQPSSNKKNKNTAEEYDVRHPSTPSTTENINSSERRSNDKADIKSTSRLKEVSPRYEIFQAVSELLNINWKLYWDVFLLKFFSDVTLSLHYQNVVIILKEVHNLSPTWIGYTMSLMAVVGVAASSLTGLISRLYKNDGTHAKRTLHACILFVFPFLLLCITSNLSLMITCFMLISATYSLLRITISEIILQRTSADQMGSLVGCAQSMFSLSHLVSPITSGVAHELYGFQGPTVLKAITALITLSASCSLFRHKVKNV
ncbi:major facilitator superfamily domain-containing protein 9-like isoform X2 [Periplaneta americana]